MDFGKAIEALKQGKKITRIIWSGYWTLETIKGLDTQTIVATLKNGNRVTATAYQEDILANDWHIVKDGGK